MTNPAPRAFVFRLALGSGLAVLVAAGPAVAWDMTSQPPRAAARSPWEQPRPWTGASKAAKRVAKDMARLYLPRTTPDEDENAEGALSPSTVSSTPSPWSPTPSALSALSVPAPTVVAGVVPPTPGPRPTYITLGVE